MWRRFVWWLGSISRASGDSLAFTCLFVSTYGGFLDHVLNPYHAWLGLPTSPPGPPRSVIVVRDAADRTRQINRPQFGVGDPVLSWSLSGLEGFWGSASLAFPLGDPARFMGSGG